MSSYTPKTSIDVVQEDILALFESLGWPWATAAFDMRKMDAFATRESARLGLDEDEACRRLKDVVWALGSVQFSLGYMLIAKGSAKQPRGHVQRASDIQNLSVEYSIGDSHFWHHTNLAMESLYRVWERLANFLVCFCSLQDGDEKLYFDGVIQRLEQDDILSALTSFKNVKRHRKHYNRVACSRNRLSHQSSRLFGGQTVTVTPSDILRADGMPYAEITATMPDLFPIIEGVKDKYLESRDAFVHVVEYVKELPNH